MKQQTILSGLTTALIAMLLIAATPQTAQMLQPDNPNPPDHIVKLIFIHHSTGENWLADGYGDLGRTLDHNNYFVSDTNYGWGPNAIGDRTDIPNWTEWFRSDDTPTYMGALFNESGQNAAYTRSLSDPGGENQIIMFKSCFPNSDLSGNPNDPPGTYEDLTVSGAKYVYNQLLGYFATRPDKLFVVITAPPLSDPAHAANARAFNQWLVNDWLSENNYAQKNVAIFDFYNILTGPDAHHRFSNRSIEHIVGGRNTLYYPSGDDHPSAAGSRKATDEFVPVLNAFYHRWQADLPIVSQPEAATAVPAETPLEPSVAQSPASGLIDDFEGSPPVGTTGWESYFQDNTDTKLNCASDSGNAHSGAASLTFQFDVAADSWATCGFYFDSVQDWSAGRGIAFYLRANQAGIPFDINLYGGSPGGHTTYVFHAATQEENVDSWTRMEIRWEQILRAEWEQDAGTPFNPAEVTGFSIGLSTPEQERIDGTLRLDDLSLVSMEPAVEPAAPAESPRKPLLPCGGAIALPLALLGLSLSWRYWRR